MSTVSGTSNDLWGVTSPKNVNALYEDSNTELGVDDFLQLMIAEITNMDFMGSGEGSGADTSAYVTQLAQITTMQQMEQLAYYSKTNYIMGLIGKEVTVADYSLGGNVTSDTGIVEKVSLSGEELEVYVNGKAYPTSKIMSVNSAAAAAEKEMDTVSSMTPYLRKRGAETATIAWNAPETDDLSKYYFSLYYSENEAFDSVAQIKENGTLAASMPGSSDMYAELLDLIPATKYYANIIISTSGGEESAYQKLIFETKEEE